MLRIMIPLVLAALSCHALSMSDVVDAGELYMNVIFGQYDTAIALCRRHEQNYKGEIIEDAVKQLVDNSKRSVIDLAYRLWQLDEILIVLKYFPFEIRDIFDKDRHRFINKKYRMVIKLGEEVDEDGDRAVYGDTDLHSGDKMAWKLIPILESNQSSVYFHIYHIKHKQYLKLGTAVDADGDHKAYGDSEANSYRHQWYLHPFKHHGEILCYIINREYQQPLKLGAPLGLSDDRPVLSKNIRVIDSPKLLGWIVLPA